MNEILKLKAFPASALLLMSLVFVSGVLFIFTFDNQLFFKLNILQLILLSIGGTFPFVILNSLYIMLFSIEDDSTGVWDDGQITLKFSGALLFGSLLSLPILYLPILIYNIHPYSFKYGLWTSVILEFIIWVKLILKKKMS